MRAILLSLALLSAPAIAGAQEIGAGVPAPLRGAWFTGDCANPQAMLALTARSAVRIEAEAPVRLFRFTGLRPVAGYTLGVGTGPEAPRLMFRAAPQGAEQRLQTIEPEAKTRDDRLPGDAAPVAWRRCAAPPAALAALHGEGIAFLGALEHLEAACASGSARDCGAAILQQGDVSGDQRLGPAELARLLRGWAWVEAAQDGAPPDWLATGLARGAVAGILAARVMIESLDYDGDGRISLEEMMQDRGAGFARATGTAAGRPRWLEDVGAGIEILRGLFEDLFRVE